MIGSTATRGVQWHRKSQKMPHDTLMRFSPWRSQKLSIGSINADLDRGSWASAGLLMIDDAERGSMGWGFPTGEAEEAGEGSDTQTTAVGPPA
jgi:hypothetical protein